MNDGTGGNRLDAWAKSAMAARDISERRELMDPGELPSELEIHGPGNPEWGVEDPRRVSELVFPDLDLPGMHEARVGWSLGVQTPGGPWRG